MKLRKASALIASAALAAPLMMIGTTGAAHAAAAPPDACVAYIQGKVASNADIASLGPNLPGGLIPQDPAATYAVNGHLVKGQDKIIYDVANATAGAKLIDINVVSDESPTLDAAMLAAIKAANPLLPAWATAHVADGTTAIKYSLKNNKLATPKPALPSISIGEAAKVGTSTIVDADGPNGPAPEATFATGPGAIKLPKVKGVIVGFPGGLNPDGAGPVMYRNLNSGTNGQDSIIATTGMFANAYNQDGTPSGLKSGDVPNRQFLLATAQTSLIAAFGPGFETLITGFFTPAAPGAPAYVPTGDPCSAAGLVATICVNDVSLLPSAIAPLCAARLS